MTELLTAATPVEPPSGSQDRVAAAARRWADSLLPPDGVDPLLRHRARDVGTLDVARAEPEQRSALLDGAAVAVSRLFPDDPLRTAARRSARALRDRARTVMATTGLPSVHLALGLVTWDDPVGGPPAAPVLLRRVDVTARDVTEQDFVLQVAPDVAVNPVLLQVLRRELGVRIGPDDLRDPYGNLVYTWVVDRLRELVPPHVATGFAVGHRAVVDEFVPAVAVTAQDVLASVELLAASPVVAALAGNPQAQQAVRAASVDRRTGEEPAHPWDRDTDLSAELAVLDLDAAQSAVLDDVVAGRHLVLQGPPGTGTTQTLAGAVAALVADGRSVLVVGAPGATGDLARRLGSVGLRDAVMDLSEGAAGAAEAVRGVARDLADASPPPPPDAPAAARVRLDSLRRSRDLLRAHVRAVHGPREPWGISAYDALLTVQQTPHPARTDVRLAPDALHRLDAATLQRRRAELVEYVELGGLRLAEGDSAWMTARVDAEADALRTLEAVHRLRRVSLPTARDTLTRATVEVGLPAPRDVSEVRAAADLLAGVQGTLGTLAPEVWQAPLGELAAGLAPGRDRRAAGEHVGWLARRRLRDAARSLLLDLRHPPEDSHLYAMLVAAAEQLATWQQQARDARLPRTGATLTVALAARAAFDADLAEVAAALPDAGLDALSLADLAGRLDRLAGEQGVLTRVPRLRELAATLDDAGLATLVAALRERGADPRTAAVALDHAVASAVVAELRAVDPRLGTFDAAAHDRAVEDYRDADVRHLGDVRDGVRRRHLERRAAARSEHRHQAETVEAAAGQTGRPAPVRNLVTDAADVLLAARPCWVMPPLLVPEMLPARALFDVVVVDGAGRLSSAEAVAALARGRQVVVAGDPAGLPPAAGGESLLGAVSAVLPVSGLTWHHRLSDERLVAFSDAACYGGRLRTFPGAWADPCLTHVKVRQPWGSDGEHSVDSEVDRVVELVLEHVRTRPGQSLGVVALGAHHAGRVDARLRDRLRSALDVTAFFRPDVTEPFFVAPVDALPGEVRDSVILTVGYGRAPDGGMVQRLGPLGRPGGAQRLHVAVSSARTRVTLVSAFAAEDLDPDLVRSPGARLLQDLLRSAVEGPPADPGGAAPDALEADLADRLAAAGLPVEVRTATRGGARLVLHHPQRPDRAVLLVQTDGLGYRDLRTSRDRDRLPAEQLARLGWTFLRVWTHQLVADPEAVVSRVRHAWQRAVADADALDRSGAAVHRP